MTNDKVDLSLWTGSATVFAFVVDVYEPGLPSILGCFRIIYTGHWYGSKPEMWSNI